MTDHLDYDRLLERGRELYGQIHKEFRHLRVKPARVAGVFLALALLERHLAEKAAEAAVMLAEQTADRADHLPMSECPQCHVLLLDYDGFGVLCCPQCGYCSHPSSTGGICHCCGKGQPATNG